MLTSDNIASVIDALEQSRYITILLAVESGSRVWGFDSANSDYDVRMIYMHPSDWYFNLQKQRDTIEIQDGDLDISGWDLAKALRLFKKGNIQIMEWLTSPIVYRKYQQFWEDMLRLSGDYYNPTAAHYHYLHMAKGNYYKYLAGKEEVQHKKYLYVIRPMLCAKWLKEYLHYFPPLDFSELLHATVDNTDIKDEIFSLVWQKKSGKELDTGSSIPLLNYFIENTFAELDEYTPRKPEDPGWEPLNILFKRTISAYWTTE
jgi:predicted nucleotidyltransferase